MRTVQSLVACISLVSGFSGATLAQDEAQGWSQTWQKVCISTHGDAGAEPRARLRASSADVVSHSRILAAGRVQVRHRPWTVSTGETSGPRRVGACIQTQRGTEQFRNTQQPSVKFLWDTSRAKEHVTGFIRLSRRTFSLVVLQVTDCWWRWMFEISLYIGQDVGLNHRNGVNPVWYSKYLHAVCIMHRSNIHVA